MRYQLLRAILTVVALLGAAMMLCVSDAANASFASKVDIGDSLQILSTADTEALTATTTAIDMCTQHAPKCPLDEDTWVGEPDAWQKTGKRWHWLSSTPSGRTVIWEWSMPYSGSNPLYAGQREDHYSDFSDAPNASPAFTTSDPFTYDWERWEPVESNFVFHQYGRASEADAFHIGEFDCESGVYYPVIDHTLEYAYTPMSVQRDGECTGGGYISTHRTELWGEALSPTRIERCDNLSTGIPAEESPKGNAVCKLSPHVGVVYQRYAIAPTTSLPASAGCESVLYAWGWESPQEVSSGQDYEAWFRNGELRFSRWLNLSDQVTSGLPSADDHQWWNTRCERAWSDMPNVLYSGIFKIGSTVYTDTVTLPMKITAEIPVSGGNLTSAIDSITYSFPSDTFTDTATVTHTIRFQSEYDSTGDLLAVNRFYEVAAAYSNTGQPADPTGPYTVTVGYTDAGAGPVIESTLALYSWDGSQWVREPTSVALPETNMVVAMPSHFAQWAVLGETYRLLLPSMPRHTP